MTTICEDCDHMTLESRKGASKWAMCLKHPRTAGTQFVARKVWDRDGPYLYCRDVNGGACPLFEPRRETDDAVQ